MPRTSKSSSQKDKGTPSPQSELTLYHYWRSSASWRVRWALEHKKIPYRPIAVDLLKGEQNLPEFLAINPAGQVPALIINGQAYSESLAILEFLEEKYPHVPLLPVDPVARMNVRQLCMLIVAGTHPLQNLLPQARHSSDPEQRRQFARFFIERGITAYEKKIESTAGSYSIGGHLTLADLCLIPQLYNAIRYDINFTHLSNINRIYQKCRALPACRVAEPEQQAGSAG